MIRRDPLDGSVERRFRALVIGMSVGLAAGFGGCAPSPAPSQASASSESIETIELRYAPADQDCPLAGLPRQVTFHIDPVAEEHVTATTPNGDLFHVWWAPGFIGGPITDRTVLDPNGVVVARDEQLFQAPAAGWPTLAGYMVCTGSNSLYVFLTGPPSATTN